MEISSIEATRFNPFLTGGAGRPLIIFRALAGWLLRIV
jgi:hypothetical protein